MDEFIEKIKTDKAFADGFKEYMRDYDSEIAAANKEMGEKIDKVMLKAICGYAKSKGMTLSDDKDSRDKLAGVSRSIGSQANEMLVKQFQEKFFA